MIAEMQRVISNYVGNYFINEKNIGMCGLPNMSSFNTGQKERYKTPFKDDTRKSLNLVQTEREKKEFPTRKGKCITEWRPQRYYSRQRRDFQLSTLAKNRCLLSSDWMTVAEHAHLTHIRGLLVVVKWW